MILLQFDYYNIRGPIYHNIIYKSHESIRISLRLSILVITFKK